MLTRTDTSRGHRETPRTKKCMDCRQGVPQGDRKEATSLADLFHLGLSLVPIKKRDRFAVAVSYNQRQGHLCKTIRARRVNFLHATQITFLINMQDISILICKMLKGDLYQLYQMIDRKMLTYFLKIFSIMIEAFITNV